VHLSAHGQLASIVAPPFCAACAAPCGSEAVLCRECEAELAAAPRVCEPGPPGVDLAVAVSEFDGVARRIVHGLKYGRRLSLASVAAAAMLATFPEGERVAGTRAGHTPDDAALAVVPVPPGPWRWRWRGFDPAEELSIAIAWRAGIPLRPCLRRSTGRRQVGRRRSERLSDPPRVWAVGAPASALLVDDVWTTGATLSACAGALREAGCDRVAALTLARAR
jgi:predicted amidophosphoribosyltransferase